MAEDRDLELVKNDGALYAPLRHSDYVSGVLPYEEICDDWRPYLPMGEKQFNRVIDYYACVTYSAHNAIETQLNRLLALNLLSPDFISWATENGYIECNQFNFSDRFTAKAGGTTHYGAFCINILDSIRNIGLVPESDYPSSPDLTWDEYYKPLTQDLLNKAKEWTKRIEIQYENLFNHGGGFVVEDIEKELKQAPIQIVRSGHALMGFDYTNGLDLFDSYEPFIRESIPESWNQEYVSAFKILVKEKIGMEQIKLWVEGMYDTFGWDKAGMWTDARQKALKDNPKLEGVNFAKAVWNNILDSAKSKLEQFKK